MQFERWREYRPQVMSSDAHCTRVRRSPDSSSLRPRRAHDSGGLVTERLRQKDRLERTNIHLGLWTRPRDQTVVVVSRSSSIRGARRLNQRHRHRRSEIHHRTARRHITSNKKNRPQPHSDEPATSRRLIRDTGCARYAPQSEHAAQNQTQENLTARSNQDIFAPRMVGDCTCSFRPSAGEAQFASLLWGF